MATHWRITYRDITVDDPDKLISAIKAYVSKRYGEDAPTVETLEQAVEWLLDSVAVLEKPIEHGVRMGFFDVEQIC